MVVIDAITDVVEYISKYDGVIFDLDDTLYPEKEYVRSGFKKISEKFLFQEKAYEKLWKSFEAGENAIDNLIQECGEYSVLNKEELLNIYRKQIPDIKLYSGVMDMLECLKKQYKLGMVTDGRPEGQWAKINALHLVDIFDNIIVTDELGGIEYRKPNPEAFCQIQMSWRLPFSNMVYIGDNKNKDFIAPIQLGMGTVYFRNKDGLYY